MTTNLPLKPDMTARVVTDENGQHIEIEGTASELNDIEEAVNDAVRCYDCGDYHDDLEDTRIDDLSKPIGWRGHTRAYDRMTVPLCPTCERERREGPDEPDADDAYERSRDQAIREGKR